MNEKREKQKEEEKVNKDRKMRSETIILRPEVPLLERLSTYAASDAYPSHAGAQTPGENGDNFRSESIFGGYHGD